MSVCLFRKRKNQASLNTPVISIPGHGSVYVYGAAVSVSISAPQFFGQTITSSVVQVSTSSSMANPATYNQSYAGTTLRTLSGLSRGATYYIRCALVGSMTGQTEWSNIVQITILSVAIGDSWLFTSGSSSFSVPANGTYKLEVCGGGGGGASSWWAGALSFGAGGGGGYTQTSKYLYAGASLNYVVGSGGGAASATGAVQGGAGGGTSQITGSGVSLYGYGGGGGYSDVWSGSGGAGGTGAGGANTSGSAGGSAWGLYNQFAGGGSSAVPPYGKGGSSYWNGSWGVEGGSSGMVRITLAGV